MEFLTFEDIFQDICNDLESKSQVQKVSKHFGTLHTDDERVSYVRPFLDIYDFDSMLDNFKKCNIKATKLREEGNKLFGKKRDKDALSCYTRSIAHAPKKSQSLTLAFANRSAVLKSMGLYEESIRDIKRALDCHYPTNLEYKLLVREGECLQQLGLHTQATDCLHHAQTMLEKSDLTQEKMKCTREVINNIINSCSSDSGITSESPPGETVPNLTHPDNSEVLCASDAIRINYSEEMGRHVVADRDISPGDVLIVEQPYASVLLPEFIHSHCSHCLMRCGALIPCSGCTLAMYCSVECQESAFSSYHSRECSTMPAILSLDMGKMAILAVRILTVSGTDYLATFLNDQTTTTSPVSTEEKRTLGYTNGKYDSLDFFTIFHLISNTSLRSVPDLFKRSLMAACLVKCLRLNCLPDVDMYGGLLLRLLQSLPCNAHEVSELCKLPSDRIAHSVEIGAAAYATLSLLNHSCDPNVVRHSHGNRAVLRAIRSVPKGGQILDNYGYHYAVHAKEERQVHLKNQYLFSCACEACCHAWPLHSELPLKPQVEGRKAATVLAASDSLQASLASVESGISEGMLGQCLSFLSLLDESHCRLCQEYNCAQEAIKQYFATLGNFHIDRY